MLFVRILLSLGMVLVLWSPASKADSKLELREPTELALANACQCRCRARVRGLYPNGRGGMEWLWGWANISISPEDHRTWFTPTGSTVDSCGIYNGRACTGADRGAPEGPWRWYTGRYRECEVTQ